jgi:hypothetical protein
MDLEMTRGDTASWDMTIRDEGGTVIDLAGWLIIMTAKNRLDDADPGVFQVSSLGAGPNGSITVIDAAAGTARVALTRAATNTFTRNVNLHYDIQVTRETPTPTTHTVAQGRLFIGRDVTRAA